MTELRELELRVEHAVGEVLNWKRSGDFGGSSWADLEMEGFVSVMVEPPAGVPQIGGTVELDLEAGDLVPPQALSLRDPAAVARQYVERTRVGLHVLAESPMPIELYGMICEGTGRQEESRQLFVGDLILYGEAHYGETYAQYVDLLGNSYNTLAQWKHVASRFPYESRTEGVPFSVYQITASLEPLEARLEMVRRYASGELEDTTELGDEVKRERAAEPDVDLLPECPACGGKLTSRKCKTCGFDFQAAVWLLHDVVAELAACPVPLPGDEMPTVWRLTHAREEP